MKKISYLFIIGALVCSCDQNNDRQESETIKKDNSSTTISTDIEKLAKLIDIKTYKPTKVKFKYTLIDNSVQNERITVPGPSDIDLQAILYFDSTTFKKLKTTFFNTDYQAPNYIKQSFDFDWLDKDIKVELFASDTIYHGHPDYFFGLGQSGKLWLLDSKLLLIKSTN